jgi:hypothetical protein
MWSFVLFSRSPFTERGENHPNEALSLEADTLGLARILLIVLSRSPQLATSHGAAAISKASKITQTPRIRSTRDRRLFGALAAVDSLTASTLERVVETGR